MVREQPESVRKGGTDVSGGGGLSGDGSVGVRGCMQTCGPGRLAALTVSEDGRLHPGP